LIEEQGRLLELAVSTKQQLVKEVANKRHQDEDELSDLRRSLEQQEQRMLQQRNQLEQERKQFTEAAVRLGKERALLEREKEELEEQKRAVETQSLLKDLPSTPKYILEKKSCLISTLYNFSSPKAGSRCIDLV
jgi:hypothetical protein